MASTFASTPSSSSPSAAPPPEEQPTKAAQACLQIVQGFAALLPMHVQHMCQLVSMEKGHVQDDNFTALPALQTLRAALDHVLGDGASSESTKRRRADPDQGNEITENRDAFIPTPNTSTIFTKLSTACAKVLQSKPGHLLSAIVGWLFHERHTLDSRVAPGRTALVNKEWWRIGRDACLWRPLVGELMPAAAVGKGRDQEGYFDCLSSYGKCLVERQVLTGDSALFEDLEMHIEVWNAAVLSGRIYSAMGPIRADTFDGINKTRLSITGPQRKEVAGPAFSAAILNPVEQKYRNIVDCITSAHQPSNPLHLCMRVSVTDRRSGKTVLIWESGKLMMYEADPCAQWVQNSLPQAACFMCSSGWTSLYHQGRKQTRPSEEFRAYVGIPLRLLPGQGHVDDKEKKYVAGILSDYHSSWAEIYFDTSHADTLATFLRSLLE